MVRKRTRRELEELGLGYGGTSVVLSLVQESERGCVLIAGEIVTDWLEKHMRVRFTKHGLNKDAQFSLVSEWNAPLINFATRIKVLRAFGEIGEHTYAALVALKDARNLCAHHPGPIDFTFPDILEYIEILRKFKALTRPKLSVDWSIQSGAQVPFSEARMHFMDGVLAIVLVIGEGIKRMKRGQKPKKV